MKNFLKIFAVIVVILLGAVPQFGGVEAGTKVKEPPKIEYKPLVKLEAYKFVSAFRNDPFKYYNDELKPYDTELKQKAYLKTDDGKQKLQSLKEEQKLILESSYEMVLGEVDHYDTKNGVFPIILPHEPPGVFRQRAWVEEMEQYIGDVLSGIWLPDKKLHVQVAEEAFTGIYRRVLVKVPEEAALKIENAGKDNVAKIKFHLTGNVHGWKSTSNLPSGSYQQKWALEIRDITVQFYDKQKNLLYEQQL